MLPPAVFRVREFPVSFEYLEGETPESYYTGENGGEKDLGFMLYDIDFENEMQAIFFRANMTDGTVDVNRCLAFGEVS